MSGSTLVLTIVTHYHIIMANCGDSRAIVIG
jgi:serine/threonine protein phosphatase PrpC